MSGRAPAGNSTSTTGPMTWVILPFWRFVAVAMWSFPESLLERLGTAHDLHQLLRDVGLASAVVLEGERRDHLLGVLRGRLHRAHAGPVLGGRRLEEGAPDLHRDVAREEIREERLAGRLVLEVNRGGSCLVGGAGVDGEQLDYDRLLGDGALELVVGDEDR